MAQQSPRQRRVADQIQRDLAGLIRSEVKDPRLGMVTVQAVRVSRDFGYAKVYVTTLDEAARDESVAVLNRAAGFLRSRLARQLRLRQVPELHFVYDESIERGEHLEALIQQARQSDREDHEHDEDD